MIIVIIIIIILIALITGVCTRASESVNGPLSEILSDIVNTLGDELEEEQHVLAYNTEEVMAGFEKVNEISKRGETSKLVAFSMDVEKLYPSFQIEHRAKDTFKMAKLQK